jgi:hypothetical protein
MKWILTSFILFALFIGTLVVISMKQEVSLVSKDYYQDELKHSEKMQRMNNANALAAKPELSFEGNKVKLSFDQFNTIENGKLTVQRPSQAALDFQFEVHPDPRQASTLNCKMGARFVSCRFCVVSQWSEYYVEKLLVL